MVAAKLVYSATSDELEEMDWMKNIEICKLVTHDPGNEKIVSQAIELNHQLQKVLDRHDALVSGRPVRRTFQPYSEIEEEEESETEQLFRRRKGKAHATLEEEHVSVNGHPQDLLGSSDVSGEESGHPVPQTSISTNKQLPSTAIPSPPARRAEREQFFKGSKGHVGSALDGQTSAMALCSDDTSSSYDG